MTTDDATPLATTPERVAHTHEQVVSFLRDRVIESGHAGIVLWLDDHLEAAVIATLAAEALGTDRVCGLRPRTTEIESDRTVGGKLLACGLDIELREVGLASLRDHFEDTVAPEISPKNGAPAAANARDRLRMTALSYAADTTGRLVAGTLNRTRWLLGAATKRGVGVGDLLPLGHRYETEIQALADHLGIPGDLFETRELPIDSQAPPETIDAVLYRLVDEDKDLERTATETGADPELVRACGRRHAATAHKRVPPPTPSDDDRHEFFHELELQFS